MAEQFIVTRKDENGKAGKPKLVKFDLTAANIVINDVPCESSVYSGAAVYMQSNGVAKNAIATFLETSNVIGIVEGKSELNLCSIRVMGVMKDAYLGLDVTKEYFLSDSIAGLVTTDIPISSNHVILKLGQPYSETDFFVLKGQRVVRL